MSQHETYRSKERRDSRCAELKRIGIRHKRTSSSGQVLSPDYVDDAFEDGRTKDNYSPNGFGGLAATYWGKLYSVEY